MVEVNFCVFLKKKQETRNDDRGLINHQYSLHPRNRGLRDPQCTTHHFQSDLLRSRRSISGFSHNTTQPGSRSDWGNFHIFTSNLAAISGASYATTIVLNIIIAAETAKKRPSPRFWKAFPSTNSTSKVFPPSARIPNITQGFLNFPVLFYFLRRFRRCNA